MSKWGSLTTASSGRFKKRSPVNKFIQRRSRQVGRAWPFLLPVFSFAVTIFIGTFLLWWNESQTKANAVGFIDALFTATSCVCVTGLSTVDISSVFNRQGQTVMIVLMQLGGLGTATYSSLLLFLFTRKVFLIDRIAVGQALLHDQSFHLGRFLIRIVGVILTIELAGFVVFRLSEPDRIDIFNAVFLAVSSFCNAGFAPWSNNLMDFQQHAGVNITVMLLIIIGGLGFAVVDELRYHFQVWLRGLFARLRDRHSEVPFPSLLTLPSRLSLPSRLAIGTSAVLILCGAIFFFFAEFFINREDFFEPMKVILPSLFQSVTCRTAGFNTVTIGRLTDVTLLMMMGLMFIGGSAGSCAGGFKTGSFRIILSVIRSAVTGRTQVVVAGRAVGAKDLSKVFLLLVFSLVNIILGIFILTITEGGMHVHGQTPFQVLEVAFEVISAFATVGLSTGLTPELTDAGKLVISLLMYFGRLGPVWLVATLHKFGADLPYRTPEAVYPIG